MNTESPFRPAPAPVGRPAHSLGARLLAVCLAAAAWLGGPVLAAEPAAGARPELWFPVGETLVYIVQWGFWTVAETRVTTEYVEEDGRELLAIRAATRTRNLMAGIYPVDDFLESVVDPATFLPVRFTKRLNEGRYHTHEVTTFNHAAGTMLWRNLKRDKEQEHPIKADTRDLISFMFYMRGRSFEPNKTYTFSVMADEKLYELLVDARDVETLKLDRFGKVRSLKLEPEAKFQGLFVRVGKLDVWISDDPRCLCVRATAKAPLIGTIQLLIDRVEGPGDDFWTHPGDRKFSQAPRRAPPVPADQPSGPEAPAADAAASS